jgi:hypothetical protein
MYKYVRICIYAGNANAFRRVVTTNDTLCPGFFKKRKASISLITNWCSVYQHIELEGCTHVIHTPFMIPTKLPLNIAVLFMATKGELAIATYEDLSKTNFIQQLFDLGVVGEQ